MKTKIKIFETNIQDGIFSTNKKFYPSNFTENDILKHFLKVKEQVGRKYNFDEKKIFQPLQKSNTNHLDYPNGKYVIIDNKNMKNEDYWFEQIPADILIISQKYKGVVIGNKMADCPILIIEDRDKGVTALAHCGASYIDRLLPSQTVDALRNSFNSKVENLYAYVGSCAKKQHYVYDTYPLWANDKKLWENCIILENDGYHIDLNAAIRKQLHEKGIMHIVESPIDTITNDRYFSHYAAMKGNYQKNGQNFVGFFYI